MDAATPFAPDRRRRRLIAVFFFITVSGSAIGHAQTRPATQPIDLHTLVTQLNDRQATVRDQAEEQLMDLSFEDLPRLQTVVTKARPIFPSQTALLREVVTQVFLAHLNYAPDENGASMLGLSFPSIEDSNPADLEAVRVMTRYPGFSSYQRLRDGDVIIALADHPDWSLARSKFPETIHKFQPGDSVRFNIDRAGRLLTVTCVLRAWPANCTHPMELEAWIQPRAALADQYWLDHFARLTDGSAS